MDTLSFEQNHLELLMETQKAMMDSLTATKQALLATQQTLKTIEIQNSETAFTLNNLWMMIASALVFIMHLGFATLESGLTRSKNTINVLFKNTYIPLVGLLTYALCGFGLMYPGFSETSGGFFGFAGFGLTMPEAGNTSAYNAGYTFWTDFLFQGMFAATCATIVSGAVAERIKLVPFMIFSIFFVALAYPIIGSWKWGGGWLHQLGFHDFAGSTLVHSVGGWAALAGVLLLGARRGKYEHGRVMPILGHNMTSAVIGVFMLWLGWFGFNGGSVLSANPGEVSKVLVNTCLAASAGGLFAAFTIYFVGRSFDLTMTLNGILAGLVGITAGADQMGVIDSCNIGAASGVLVVFAVLFFDKLRVDDPVGALSVHLVCGMWGTLAVGIFGQKASIEQFIHQAIGISACGTASFVMALIIFAILKFTIGIRVTQDEEIYGLDYVEHGMEAYPDFVTK
jgi:ammonium transporter, Amt family